MLWSKPATSCAKQPGGLFGSSASCRRVERQDVDHGPCWRAFSDHPKQPHGGWNAARAIWSSSAGAAAAELRGRAHCAVAPASRIERSWLPCSTVLVFPFFGRLLRSKREKYRIFVLTGVCFFRHISLPPFRRARKAGLHNRCVAHRLRGEPVGHSAFTHSCTVSDRETQ